MKLDETVLNDTEPVADETAEKKAQPAATVIGQREIKDAQERLEKYKTGKSNLDSKIIDNEQFWKQRNWDGGSAKEEIKPTSWLFNVILSKHADMMDGYPEANVRPKEEGDKREATMLSSILPVVFEANGFRKTYSKCAWYKLIKGTAVYGIFWDPDKLFGRGDISIEKIDVLNLFWEPGVTDIQKSREIFHVSLADKADIEAMYPFVAGKLSSDESKTKKYIYDDTVDTTDKCAVIDWYYKKRVGNRTVLHYCKFVDDNVLYATENDTQRPQNTGLDPVTGEEYSVDAGKSMAESGLYEHGLFPFVFDPLFIVEGSPCGFSYTDICKNAQEKIDLLDHSIVKNALLAARPRFFVRTSGSVNEKEFADYSKDFVHVDGSLDDASIRAIQTPELPTNTIAVLNNKIEEMKETSGNRDVNNGSSTSGVTAASAIAALQEASGKTSRDALGNTYDAFKDVTYQVIELIRQFYNTARQFRITGENGQEEFVQYSNEGIKAQEQGQEFGVDLGMRIPQFDIEVSAQKATAYSKMSQNELALQFYSAGMFNPNNADQALACLDMMDFTHKQDIVDRVQQNGTLATQVQQLLSLAMGLATTYEPALAQQLAAQFGMQMNTAPAAQNAGVNTDIAEQNADGTVRQGEHAIVEKAREKAQNATQVD